MLTRSLTQYAQTVHPDELKLMPLKLRLLKPKRRREESPLAPASPGPVTIVSEYWRQSPPDVLRQEIAQRHRRPGAREEVANAISCEQLEFKVLWNRSLPINQLPYELIAEIFTLILVQTISESHVCMRLFDTDFWRLMGICRHWREVIVATPTLWRTIELGRRMDWINLCLSRSLTAPINILGIVPHPDCRYNTLWPVFPLIHRVRSLDFEVRVPIPEWKADVIATFPLLFSGGMPSLERLSLRIHPISRDTYHMPVTAELTSQRLPRLQSLILIKTVAPRDPSLYTQLRILSLTECALNLPFNCFLDALSSCTGLEDLYLENTLHHLSGDWMHEPEPRPRRRPLISHPHLGRFIVSGHGAACTARFLAHFHVRPSVRLKISAGVDPRSPRDGGALSASVTSMLPPRPAATLEPLAAVDDIWMCMSCYTGPKSFWISTDREPRTPETGVTASCSLSVDVPKLVNGDGSLRDPAHAPSDYYGRGSVRELVALLGRSPVMSLSVIHVCPDTVASWAAVFRAFPLLERLSIWGTWGMEDALGIENTILGLHAASSSMKGSGPALATRLACPNLRHVSVHGLGRTAAYEALRTCMGYRGRRGAVLEHLDLELYRDNEHLSPAVCRACIMDIARCTVRLKLSVTNGAGLEDSADLVAADIDPVHWATYTHCAGMSEDAKGGSMDKASFKSALRRLRGNLSRRVKLNRKAEQM